jgi:hypothetical protein
VPVGKTQAAFRAQAEADGVDLDAQSLPWICEQGHYGLLRMADASQDEVIALRAMVAADALERIFLRLGGDLGCLKVGRPTPLRGDFLHPESKTLVEIDEFQHFTTSRLNTFQDYPADLPVGYDVSAYRKLCLAWSRDADKYRANKEARCFGAGGRRRQRAYYDPVRALAAPAVGYAPVIRIPAPHDDGARANRENRLDLRGARRGSQASA